MIEDEKSDNDYSGYVTKQILAIGHEVIKYRNRVFEPYGVTGKQAMALGYIVINTVHKHILTQNDIAKEFGLRASSVNSLLGYLEYRGFIERKISPDDARAKIVSASEKSIQIFGDLRSCCHSIENEILKGLSKEDIEKLKDNLQKIQTNISEL